MMLASDRPTRVQRASAQALWAEDLRRLAAPKSLAAAEARRERAKAEALGLSVDLVAAAEQLVPLCAAAREVCGSLKERQRALERYERCWLPLLRRHRSERLVPPADVEWAWLCHCISGAYLRDCVMLFGEGTAPEKATFSSDEERAAAEDKTRRLWENAFGPASPAALSEPYAPNFAAAQWATLDATAEEEPVVMAPAAASRLAEENHRLLKQDIAATNDREGGGCRAERPGPAGTARGADDIGWGCDARDGETVGGGGVASKLSVNLQDLMADEEQFAEQVAAAPHFGCASFLTAAAQRYRRFLLLLSPHCNTDPGQRPAVQTELMPLVDVGLLWRAHMMYPKRYAEDLICLQFPDTLKERGASAREELFAELTSDTRSKLVDGWASCDDGVATVPYLRSCAVWEGRWNAAGREALQRTKALYGTIFGEPYLVAGSCFHDRFGAKRQAHAVMHGSDPNCVKTAFGRGSNQAVCSIVTSMHRKLLEIKTFQIVIDIVGLFGAQEFLDKHKARGVWYQLMPIKEGSRPESTSCIVRSPRVCISEGEASLRCRHVVTCDEDTLGLAVKVKRSCSALTSLSGKAVVGGFTINFHKIGLFEDLHWCGHQDVLTEKPFLPKIGTMYVTLTATPLTQSPVWHVVAPLTPKLPATPSEDVEDEPVIRKYVTAGVGDEVLAEFTSLLDTNRLRIEICDASATLNARRAFALAEELPDVTAYGTRCVWAVSSSGSRCHELRVCTERVCVSELPRFVLLPSSKDVQQLRHQQYVLIPGRQLQFSLGNEYRLPVSVDVDVGGEIGESAAEALADEAMFWTLLSVDVCNGIHQRAGKASALINVAQSRLQLANDANACDVYFAVALGSAMTLSLAKDEAEWKRVTRMVGLSKASQLQRQIQIGHKELCDDTGWVVLESLSN